MKMSDPIARVLDFSNVGVAAPTISFEPREDLDLPEQNTTRARTDPQFALGHGPFAMRAYGRERRARLRAQPQEQELEYDHHILIRSTNRYFTIKKRTEDLIRFNPMTIDEFYAKPCQPGHVRIFRHLVSECTTNFGIQSRLLVSLPFRKLNAYMNKLLQGDYNAFKATPSEFKFQVPAAENTITKARDNLMDIWNGYVKIRHQMLRLANAFLYRKSHKKMLSIPHYITMEDPSPKNCIEWTDLENRCSYRIHGETLLKSMMMYLHHSEYGFPNPLWPKNPSTNAPFSQGQIEHIIYELYTWCGKNRKPVPYILTKFQEAKFCLQQLIVKNRPELTLYACRELFTEIHLPDAIEMWLDMIEEFAGLYNSMTRDELEVELPRWILSQTTEKNTEMIKKWQDILPDLIQFSRFKYFNRSDWEDLGVLKKMVRTLWANTFHAVKKYSKARKAALIRAVQSAVRLNSDGEETDSSEDTVENPPAVEITEAPPPAVAPVIQHIYTDTSHALLAYFNNQINSPLVNQNFEISSEWDNVLQDSEGAVDLEYNLMMLNSLILPLPPIPPQLPALPPAAPAAAAAATAGPADAPVNSQDSFEAVD